MARWKSDGFNKDEIQYMLEWQSWQDASRASQASENFASRWNIRKASALACLVICMCFSAVAGEPPLKLLRATFWGTAADDDIQGAAQAPDGSVYVVGNTGASAGGLPGNVAAKLFGPAAPAPACGCGFVAHFSSDMGRLLHYAEFADGIAIFTSAIIGPQGVYVSGYASEGLEPLLSGKPGLISKYPLAHEVRLIKEGRILEANGLRDKDPVAGRLGLGRLGAPFVLRLSADLQTITAGTYLEGWQQVYDKDRVKTIRPREMFPKEFFWQPVSLGLFKEGDLAVSHDGGYFRILADADRKLAGTNTALLGKLGFYDCNDWVSRLSPDLSRRIWRQAIFTPSVNSDVAKVLKDGWPHPHYGNPRTHRMRLDSGGNVVLCGWSATQTKSEPWWSPYLWKLDGATGRLLMKYYEYDPMSGVDNRMNGTVADTAISSFAFDSDGNLLVSLFADGGNTVMEWSPQASLGRKFEGVLKNNVGVKLVHWWGMIHRVNAQTREGLGGVRMASRGSGAAGPAWVVDLASLPEHKVLAVGRCNLDFPWSDNAWHRASVDENPVGFLRVYDREFELLFSTALPGVVPFELVPLTDKRFLITGQARNPTAPAANGFYGQSRGKADGWFAVVQLAEIPEP